MSNLKLAIRKLARRPTFSLTTIACLALGIGAVTAIGSVVNTLFLQSASVRELDRVVFFMAMREGVEPFGVSPIEIEAFRARSTRFQSMGFARTLDGNSASLGADDRLERVAAARASTAYFATLGVEPALGRLFTSEEERSGGPGAVLLGHGLWTRRFAADPQILGRRLRVDGEVRSVVGVLPERFDLPSKTALWIPLELDFERLGESSRTSHSYMMIGRLREGTSRERAEEELVAIARQLQVEFPRSNQGWSVALTSFRNLLLGDVQGTIRVMVFTLAGAVGLLLLIACVNAAHLFLARCLEQEREIALSAALGASRWTLFRQLFLESLLLAGAAGVLGSGLALAAVPLFLANSSIHEGAYTDFFRTASTDARVLLLALGASAFTALLFGTLPLWTVLGRSPSRALRSGARAGEGRSQVRWSRMLVAAEVATSTALLIGAGLLVRSLDRLGRLELGFRPESRISIDFSLPDSDFPDREDRVAFSRSVLERLRGLPGVLSAGTTSDVPLQLGTWDNRYLAEGAPVPAEGEVPWAAYRAVSPGYLETLGVTLLRGRTFAPEDRAGAPKVAVVSEELARRAWGDADPIGRRIGHPDQVAEEGGWWTIVGLVRDVKEDRYNFRIDRPVWYVPYEQLERPGSIVNVLFRVESGGAEAASEVRRAAAELYPQVTPGEILPLEPHVAGVVAAERTATTVALALAILGTALASIGLYGVMAYSVRRRFVELGLRMAIGATPRQVSRLVVRDGLRAAALGLAAGFAGAFLLARTFSNLLFETRPWDPLTYGAVTILFAGVSIAACLVPASRAAATRPVEALRME